MTGEVLRHEVRLVGVRLADKPLVRLEGCHVWVTGGNASFRADTAKEFEERGCSVRVLEDVAAQADDHDLAPDVVIDGGLPPEEAHGWRKCLANSLALLQRMQERCASNAPFGSPRLVVIAWAGEDGAAAAVQGIWSGLAKTLPREIPSVRSQVVTVHPGVRAATAVRACLVGTDLIEVTVSAAAQNELRVEATLAVPLPPSGASTPLTAADTIAITGGARGIGFQFALGLAERFGARVLVSGREDLEPHEGEPWLTCSEAQFRELRTQALRRRGQEPIRELRRRFDRYSRLRETAANLALARARSARVEYVRCDVTQQGDVRALLNRAGPELTVVVHNAGIDAPSRLATKTAEQMCRIIEVKHCGLENILEALGEHPLTMLCLVGSLTGRYGGMVGQLEYSAANETLAFASRELATQVDYAVKCLAWPTWDGIGLITNPTAAAKYMRPIDNAQAVSAWIEELQHGASGEIAFLSGFAAVSAQHLLGIPVPSNWAGARRMLTRRFFLGQVMSYEPTRAIVSRHRVNPATMPYFASGRVDGRAAMPISAVLEYLINCRDGFLGDYSAVGSLQDITVHVDALHVNSSGVELEREVRIVDETADGPRLAATLSRIGASGDRELVATAVLQITTQGHSHSGLTMRPGERTVPATRFPHPRYRWTESLGGGHAFSDAIAIASPVPLELTLPTAQVESTLAAWDSEGVVRICYLSVGADQHAAPPSASASASAPSSDADPEAIGAVLERA
ncbi:MAG: KR domain-containing protein [Pseudoclavibacter sp.]